jgi:hypothetical protein
MIRPCEKPGVQGLGQIGDIRGLHKINMAAIERYDFEISHPSPDPKRVAHPRIAL